MPTIMINYEVQDLSKWRPVFAQQIRRHDAEGITITAVYQNLDSAKDVLVCADVVDFEKAKKALVDASPSHYSMIRIVT